MKKVYALFAIAAIVLFAGCYEVHEEIVVHEDGSGTYVTNMDLSQLINMMQTFAGEEELSKEGLDRPIDTVLEMKKYLDSAENLTPEQKELLKEATVHLQMNLKEDLFKMGTHVPFKDLHGLQMLLSGTGNMAGLSQVFKNVFAKDSTDADSSNPNAGADLSDIGNIFNVTVQDGLISRQVDSVKFKALMANPEMAQIKQMSSSGMAIDYTTSITLPRPVKNISNPMLKLSDDKKTVTFKYNLLDLLNDPAKFDYSIGY